MARIHGDPGHAGGPFNLRPGSLSQHHLPLPHLYLLYSPLREGGRRREHEVWANKWKVEEKINRGSGGSENQSGPSIQVREVTNE